MATKREYNIIYGQRHDGHLEFTKLVNEQLKNPNTQLVGGVFVNDFNFYQAIVTETEEIVEKEED